MAKYTRLKGDQAFYQVPPNIIGMLSGVRYAHQTKTGAITLTYLDGRQETRETGNPDIDSFDSFFNLVTHVQATRELGVQEVDLFGTNLVGSEIT